MLLNGIGKQNWSVILVERRLHQGDKDGIKEKVCYEFLCEMSIWAKIKLDARMAREEEMLTLRLPQDIETRLSDLARETRRTKSYYAKEAIVKYLDWLEDTYLAEKTLEKVRCGQERVFSTEDVEKLLNVGN